VKQFFTTNDGKKDIIFVPVTLNYDRVIEGDIFPLDLLGEKSAPMSFFKFMKQFNSIRKELGKVVVRYAQPISL
jgi:glycerol-3-phosphate O-acyltransferase